MRIYEYSVCLRLSVCVGLSGSAIQKHTNIRINENCVFFHVCLHSAPSKFSFFVPQSTHNGPWQPKIDPRTTQMDPKVDQTGFKSSICRHIDGPMDRCAEIPIYRPIDVSTRRGANLSIFCLVGRVYSLKSHSVENRHPPPT